MQWTQAKTAKDVVLDGVTVEVDRTDTSINAVTFTDASGKGVRVRMNGYSMTVEVPTPPKTVQKSVITGSIRGIVVNEVFDSEHEAERRRDELSDGLYEDAKLTVESVELSEEMPF